MIRYLVQMLSPVSFADVNKSALTAKEVGVVEVEQEEDKLTDEASANEEWKKIENLSTNLWLDTLDDDCLSSDEDQNDLEIQNVRKML